MCVDITCVPVHGCSPVCRLYVSVHDVCVSARDPKLQSQVKNAQSASQPPLSENQVQIGPDKNPAATWEALIQTPCMHH